MGIDTKNKNGIIVFYVSGEINIDTSESIKKVLDKTLKQKTPKILLNLKNVDYIDSLGMSDLILFLKDVKAANGTLALSNLPSKIKSIFTITKCEKVFSIYETEEEALRRI